MVMQWSSLLPQSEKVLGSIPILVMGPFFVKFVFSSCVGVGFPWMFRFCPKVHTIH